MSSLLGRASNAPKTRTAKSSPLIKMSSGIRSPCFTNTLTCIISDVPTTFRIRARPPSIEFRLRFVPNHRRAEDGCLDGTRTSFPPTLIFLSPPFAFLYFSLLLFFPQTIRRNNRALVNVSEWRRKRWKERDIWRERKAVEVEREGQNQQQKPKAKLVNSPKLFR